MKSSWCYEFFGLRHCHYGNENMFGNLYVCWFIMFIMKTKESNSWVSAENAKIYLLCPTSGSFFPRRRRRRREEVGVFFVGLFEFHTLPFTYHHLRIYFTFVLTSHLTPPLPLSSPLSSRSPLRRRLLIVLILRPLTKRPRFSLQRLGG
jgi:hypothetical protein